MKALSICILLTLMTVLSSAETNANPGATMPSDSTRSLQNGKLLLTRMDEINATDKSRMAKSDVKALRKELRMIRGELKELDKGTYISARKIVVILLLPFIAFSIIE